MPNNLIRTQEQSKVLKHESQSFFDSGCYPQFKNVQQLFLVVCKGQELGLEPLAAIDGIHVIQGKPTVSPQTMMAIIRKSGFLEKMKVDPCSEKKCVVFMQRKDTGEEHTEEFTIEDARKMGLAGKPNWTKQPKVMLRWRCIAACSRLLFPDVLGGLYLREEIEPNTFIKPSGEIIEAEFTQQKPLPPENVENEKIITNSQAKRLWTIATKKHGDQAEKWLRAYYKENFQKESTKTLTQVEYNQVIEQLNKFEDQPGDTRNKTQGKDQAVPQEA